MSVLGQSQPIVKVEDKLKDSLISIDYNDLKYSDLRIWIHDTITNDGWTIKYLVKDDSTKYKDIYIRWSKDKKSGLFYGGSILLMRRYFIPYLVGENKTHIYLQHGCATGCMAILTLSKDSLPKDKDYELVRDYSIKNEQIVYCNYNNNFDTLKVVIVDLKRGKEKSITFKNICYDPMANCIDSLSLDSDYVKLSATLIDRKNKENLVKEDYIIRLDD